MIGNMNNKVTMSINAMTTLASITNSYSVTLHLGNQDIEPNPASASICTR